MIRGVVGPAQAVVVHSDWAADRVRQQSPEAFVRRINHYVQPAPPSSAAEGAAFRVRHGISTDETMIVSLGFVTAAKQIEVVIQALSEAASALPPFRYVVAGEVPPGGPNIAAEAARVGLADRVLATGYLPPEDIAGLLSASDVIVNLRFPTLGETSGTVMRALAHGVCTIVNDVGAFHDLPKSTVIQLPWDELIHARLRDAIISAARSPKTRQRYGRAAAKWVSQECSLERCGNAYTNLLREVSRKKPTHWFARATGWSRPSRSALGAEQCPGALWDTAGLFPDAYERRVLAIVDDPADFKRLEARGVALPCCILVRTSQQVLRHAARAPRRELDVILVALKVHVCPKEPSELLRKINAALGFGGILVIAIEAGSMGSHPLLLEREGRHALEQAGFEVEETAVAPPAQLTELETPLDRRVWTASKASEFTMQPTVPA